MGNSENTVTAIRSAVGSFSGLFRLLTDGVLSNVATDKQDSLAKLRIQRDDSSAPSRRRSWARLSIMACLFLGVAAIAWVGFVGFDSLSEWSIVPDAIKSRTEVRLGVVTVQTGRSADATVVATGYLESRRQARIGARAPGRILAVNVEEGTRVEDGEILAVLEHADMDASLAAAKAVVSQSKAQLVEQDVEIQRTRTRFLRARAMRSKAGISEADYDQARFQHDAAIARRDSLVAAIALADARVSEAEHLRENMFIRASFAGTVISKDAEVGESILPGGMGEASGRGSVVTIADLDHLEVECDVKEDFISRVSAGRSAEVAVDAVPDRRYQGRVRKIIPMGDRARATIKVKVEILDADERLFPEMSATVYFLPDSKQEAVDTSPRVFCPTSAVVRDEPSGADPVDSMKGEGQENAFVFLMAEDDRVRRVQIVTMGEDRDGRIEVVSGLSGGERCVLQPASDMNDGDLVRVSE